MLDLFSHTSSQGRHSISWLLQYSLGLHFFWPQTLPSTLRLASTNIRIHPRATSAHNPPHVTAFILTSRSSLYTVMRFSWHCTEAANLSCPIPMSPPPQAAARSFVQDGTMTRAGEARHAKLHNSLSFKFIADLLLMNGARNADGRDEKCIQSIDRETRRRESTSKAQTYIIG